MSAARGRETKQEGVAMTSKMNAQRLALQIQRALEETGAAVDVRGSGLSEAQYITAETEADTIAIRVASHDSKPSYMALHGECDYYVGAIVHADGRIERLVNDCDGDWLDAVLYACKRLAVVVPGRIEKLVSRRNAAIDGRKVRLAAQAGIEAFQAAEREKAYEADLNARLRASAAMAYDFIHGKKQSWRKSHGFGL